MYIIIKCQKQTGHTQLRQLILRTWAYKSGAGKVHHKSIGQTVSTQPTIGSNIEEISHNNVKFLAWDLGGQETMRTVWDAYYLNTDV